MDNCTIDCIQIMGNFSSQDICSFVQDNCVQDTLQIVQGYYCLTNASFVMLLLVTILFLLITYYSLNIATDDFLAPCLEEFIIKLDMSEALAGITFLALANGAPDIITAVVAGTSSSDTTILIPFGSIYGAALFSMAFILAMVITYSPGNKITLNMRQNLVPLIFYLAGTVYLSVISMTYQKMNIILATVFFSFYLIYIAIVIYEERTKKKAKKAKELSSLLSEEKALKNGSNDQQDEKDKNGEYFQNIDEKVLIDEQNETNKKVKPAKQSFSEEMDDVYASIHQEQEEKDRKEMGSTIGKLKHYIRIGWTFVFNFTVPVILKDKINPPRLVASLLLSPVVLWFAKGISDSFQSNIGGLPYAFWFSLPSAVLLVYYLFYSLRGAKPYFVTIYNIYSFFVIVAWISLVVAALINMMELLQLLTNINSVFLGLTVFAWANSIGDYLSITTFAKRGYSSTAISGIFSGQLLNFLIGFGVSLIINSLTNGQYDFKIFQMSGNTFDQLSDLIVIVVIGLSFAYMLYMLVVIVLKKGQLSTAESKIAKIYYILFVLVALVISVMTDFFREMSCDL